MLHRNLDETGRIQHVSLLSCNSETGSKTITLAKPHVVMMMYDFVQNYVP